MKQNYGLYHRNKQQWARRKSTAPAGINKPRISSSLIVATIIAGALSTMPRLPTIPVRCRQPQELSSNPAIPEGMRPAMQQAHVLNVDTESNPLL